MTLSTEMKSCRTVSVIIPTLNGGDRLQEVLAALTGQSRIPDEVLIIDSSSGDDTVKLAGKYGARVISIARADFDHGGTRTMAARTAAGDILIYLTQDAVPDDSQALEKIVAPFADPVIAASYGRQVPYPDATHFARHLRLFNYPAISSVRCWEDRKKYGFKTIFISNSFAAYRKSSLADAGFFQDGLLFGEDTLATARLLKSGFCIAYVAEARVRHSHNYTVLEEFRRYFDIGVFHSTQEELLRDFGAPGGEGKRYVVSELSQLARDRAFFYLPECLLRNSMKFLAYNLGKRYSFLPRRLSVFCSMNSGWWTKQ